MNVLVLVNVPQLAERHLLELKAYAIIVLNFQNKNAKRAKVIKKKKNCLVFLKKNILLFSF